MKIAAIYCRVSTEDQEREGTSLKTQLEACLDYCHSKGYQVLNHFTEACSGLTLDRPKLDQLRDLIKAHSIETVVIYCLDRLTRDPNHGVILQDELRKHQIELEAVSEPIDGSELGQLINYIRGWAAKQETEKFKDRTRRGKKARALEGRLSTGGSRLFGYTFADGRRIINEEETKLVRLLFDKFANQDYTLYRAAVELNNAGIESPRGGKWNECSISRLLNNTAYIGVTYAFKYRALTKNIRQLRDRSEWIELPEATPAIVTPEVFNAAHEQLKLHSLGSRRRRQHDYLLANGHLICGTCGHTMAGSFIKRTNDDWLYYRCISKFKPWYYAPCSQPNIPANRVEPQVWDEIWRILTTPQLVLEQLNKKPEAKYSAAIDAEIILVESAIQKSRDEEQRYLKQYGRGVVDEALLDAEIRRVRKHRSDEEAKLAQLKANREALKTANIENLRLSKIIPEIAKKLYNADYELKRKALKALDIKVTVQPSGDMHINGRIPVEVEQGCGISSHSASQFNQCLGVPFSRLVILK